MVITIYVNLLQEVEAENNTLVVVLSCDASELRLLLTFMYTGEVTASKKVLPSLLRLAQTLKVSGLTDADTVGYFSLVGLIRVNLIKITFTFTMFS